MSPIKISQGGGRASARIGHLADRRISEGRSEKWQHNRPPTRRPPFRNSEV